MAKDKKEGPEEKVTVRANDAVIAKKGAFHDPDPRNAKAIGAKPIEVIRTPFVSQRIRSGDLVEVR